MRRLSGSDIVLKVLGLLLLAAAVLKGHELLIVQVASKDLWSWRPFLILTVELELALGIWLLSGLFKKAAWLSLMRGNENLTEEDKAKVLDLLQSGVNAANKLTNKAINLLWKIRQSQPCDGHECQQLVDELIEHVSAILGIQKRTAEYENDR